jgi:uncharacterized protein (DUF1800 family)
MGAAAAARLLTQATMGTSLTDLTTASNESYDAWFAAQAAMTPSLELPQVAAWDDSRIPAWWYNAVNGEDQLRQRMAFALSEILVVSGVDPHLGRRGQGLAYYYDTLTNNALGNFRTLLGAVSMSPEMGIYLTFINNSAPNPKTGVRADENYAREIMQLFTIGVWELNPDGSQILDSNGKPIPTYTQSDVTNLADVFTGWVSGPVGSNTGEPATITYLELLGPMACSQAQHDTSAKTIVGGVSVAGGGTCASDMAVALDTLFNHPNTGPFISKQLIQRLVTSNPSGAYVTRISAIFANNGQGVRGDLLAVAKAILTDPEAVTLSTAPGAGKLREPVLRLTALWRAFSAAQSNGVVNSVIPIQLAANDFGETALESPTVFNFFTPTYQRAGPLSAAGLVVPEFQITNEDTIVLTANDLQTQAYKFVSGSGAVQTNINGSTRAPGPTDMVLHTAAWENYANDAATLVAQLELVFMPGQMSPAMARTLVGYVNAIPASSPANRVMEAASLMLDSPQYSIQH